MNVTSLGSQDGHASRGFLVKGTSSQVTDRVIQPFADVDTLLDSVRPRPPVPVFKVPREAFRRLLKQALAELHDARRRAKGAANECR